VRCLIPPGKGRFLCSPEGPVPLAKTIAFALRHADAPCGRPAIGGHFAPAGLGAGLRCACGNAPEVPWPLTGWRNALRFLARPERGPPLRRIRMTFPSGTRRGCFPAPGQG